MRNFSDVIKLLDWLHNVYRWLFPIGAALALTGVGALWLLTREYNRFGGDQANQKPEA